MLNTNKTYYVSLPYLFYKSLNKLTSILSEDLLVRRDQHQHIIYSKHVGVAIRTFSVFFIN